MKAIILAAGRGSRMKNKTDVLPKCLTTLWGKTLLEWQVKALTEAGIKEIGIVTGYHAQEIKQPNLARFYNAYWAETNMFASLLEAEEWLKADTCIISYADIIYTKQAIYELMRSEQDISLVYYTKFLNLWKSRFANPLEDIETFKTDVKGKLLEIGGKADCLDQIQGQYMGLLKFTPQGWAKIRIALEMNPPKPIEKIDMTSMLNHLLSRGIDIHATPYDEFWIEVDDQDDLALYESWDRSKYDVLLS